MSVPTITSVSPSSGPTIGDFVVGIVGTNFRVPASLPALGQSNNLNTVRVTVDGETIDPQFVSVFDSTFITALMPKHAITSAAIAIRVDNLDDNGDPIAGENATRANAFSYVMPIHTNEADGDLPRLIRVLLRELKKQFMQTEITYAVHTDYDSDTGDQLHVTQFAKLPGMTLMGPDLDENRFYSINEQPTVEDPASPTNEDGSKEAFVETRVPYTVDLLFEVLAVSDNKAELLNMMSNFVMFMHKNKFVFLDRDKDDPSKGNVKYEMDFQPGGAPKSVMGAAGNSNLRSFSAKFLIRGFDIETTSGVDAGTTAGVPNQAIVSRGKTSDSLILQPIVQTKTSP